MEKVISIESEHGPYQMLLQRVLRMVPDRDKHDIELQRLLAFRLRIDGESATREFLMQKIRDMIQCAYPGRLYDFLKDDRASTGCVPDYSGPEPPEIA
ncbi:MAG: hypothetical protein PVG41_03390 [Desulfobacteraceae bacterium]